jgi:protocatechuate 3,4-dioxygenase beta subunit
MSAPDLAPFRPYVPGSQPDYDTKIYGSTALRHPTHHPVRVPQSVTELSGPQFSQSRYPSNIDISKVASGEAQGQRIVVEGHVRDEDGRPVANTMIELWQANSCGRYHHEGDQHDAPLDAHFQGSGRVFTDAEGKYRYTSIKPGAYPWRNHHNAWRPNHIHYSLFGPGFATRLITQMYFEGDPLLKYDPIYNSLPDPVAATRMIAAFDIDLTEPEWALGYRFDVVLRGRGATPFEDSNDHGAH